MSVDVSPVSHSKESQSIKVPFESVVGAAVEVVVFFIAQTTFIETLPRSTFYYLMKWILEELALFASWEFWERPHFRTIMLKQLTVRNILFQLRYLPNFHNSVLAQIYPLQPVVVLTLALVHIITERVALFRTGKLDDNDTRIMVSKLFARMGVHSYLAFAACEYLDPSFHNLLWLKTCLVTLIFQDGVLMFAVVFYVLATGDVTLVARLMDLVVATQVGGFLTDTWKSANDSQTAYSIPSSLSEWHSMLTSAADNKILNSILQLSKSTGYLGEIISGIFSVLFLWTNGRDYLFYALIGFGVSYSVEKSIPKTQHHAASKYFLESILVALSLLSNTLDLEDERFPLLDFPMDKVLVFIACILSCQGLVPLAQQALL